MPPKQLGHGDEIQANQAMGKQQADDEDAEPQQGAKPESGQPVYIAEAHRSDGRSAAQHDRGHGGGIEDGPEASARDQEVLAIARATQAEPPDQYEADRVSKYDGEIKRHRACSQYLSIAKCTIRDPNS
jgi:hypothetical protein